MKIREYEDPDKTSWIRCRVVSFLDSSYFDDVQNFREEYENPVIQMVAIENGQVIGFLDCEYEEEPGDVCYFEGAKGGVIWHLGILPEYRGQGLATALWLTAQKKLRENGVERIEVWTQDDVAVMQWYLKQGFLFRETYLNAFLKGNTKDPIMQRFINFSNMGEVYGIRNVNFEV